MKKYLLAIGLFVSTAGALWAQVPEDAVKYSFNTISGSARNMAVGGVGGSLGGDMTSAYLNPAGLGFYKIGEASLSLGLNMNKDKTNFLNNSKTDKKSSFNLGSSGVVLAFPHDSRGIKSSTFTIGATKTADFGLNRSFSGLNNISSYAEVFSEEIYDYVKGGGSLSDIEKTSTPFPYSASLAWNTFVVDTVNNTILAAPEQLLNQGQAIRQNFTRNNSGGVYEVNVGYAAQTSEKFLWGASVGLPYYNLRQEFTVTESDTSANIQNNFASYTYNDNNKTTGLGIVGRLGLIYRPVEYFRLGASIQTPTFFSLTDTRNANIKHTYENPTKTVDANSDAFTGNRAAGSEYYFQTPWKAMVSASYVFREQLDVTKQKGFISADVEYVNHKAARYRSSDEQPTQEINDYYASLNKTNKDLYKGAFNFRVGGELKFDVIMARLGFGYYGSPYNNTYRPQNTKANRMNLSGGLGYRNKGVFADLTYVHSIINDVDVPYRLSTAYPYATTKDQLGSIMFTIGFKF